MISIRQPFLRFEIFIVNLYNFKGEKWCPLMMVGGQCLYTNSINFFLFKKNMFTDIFQSLKLIHYYNTILSLSIYSTY